MPESIKPRPMQAFGLALLVEILLLCVAATILANTNTPRPTLSEPAAITLLNDDPPPPELPPEPKPVLHKPSAQPKMIAPQTDKPVPVPLTETPTAFTEPVPEPPPSAPSPSSEKIDPSIEYAAKVRSAVQAAVYYPPSAAALHFVGRVRVEFHLRDSIASEAHVLIASGIGLIDRAALQSVQITRYPEPPTEMRGHDGIYQVWVEFNRLSK